MKINKFPQLLKHGGLRWKSTVHIPEALRGSSVNRDIIGYKTEKQNTDWGLYL